LAPHPLFREFIKAAMKNPRQLARGDEDIKIKSVISQAGR